MDRGFEHLIDIWGADHHGYVPRMKAAFTALPPHDPGASSSSSGSSSTCSRAARRGACAKRRGDIVTIDDLVDAIGVDAARFLLVGRSHDTTLDLDLDLAVRAEQPEPGLLRAVRARAHLQHPAQPAATGRGAAGAAKPVAPAVDGRARRAGADPQPSPASRTCCSSAVEHRAPHRVHRYLGELAAGVPRVLPALPRARRRRRTCPRSESGSARPSRQTLAAGLDLLGVSAPESM